MQVFSIKFVRRYPITAAFRLSPLERTILEGWLTSHKEIHLHENLVNSLITDENRLHYFGELPLNELKELPEWKQPVLIFCGKETTSENYLALFRMGIAACTEIFLDNDCILFPEMALPPVTSTAFTVIENGMYRDMARQLFRFGGFDMRTDFRTADEMIHVIRELHQNKEAKNRSPVILLLDLDSVRIDILSFCYQLRKLYAEKPSLRMEQQIIVMKDFSKPGSDIQTLAKNLNGITKRIFHPDETVLLLLESLIFHNINDTGGGGNNSSSGGDKTKTSPWTHPLSFRNIYQILHGEKGKFPATSPGNAIRAHASEIKRLASCAPFIKLYELFSSDSTSKGALLAAQPDIDSGNLLHGVRRPDPSRKLIENPGE